MPDSFPISLGWIPAITEAGTLTYESDHAARAKELLISQFQKPRIQAMVTALCAGIQDAEDVCWQLLTERWIDTAVGVQLDGLGAILDLPRAGWVDEVYRQILRAQILALRSKGHWVDLFKILDATGVDLTLVLAQEWFPAAITVHVDEVIGPDILANDVFHLLVRAKPECVRLCLFFLTVDDDKTFDCSSSISGMTTSATRGLADATGGTGYGKLAGVLSSSAKA